MRIVAGSARGRRLEAPASVTRPTSDRAREGLFSTLEHLLGTLVGVRVLDLFAGTGAIGLEAASRGAASVDLVESDARAVGVCRENIDNLKFSEVKVHHITTDKWLSQVGPGTPYDVVTMDPPYSDSNESVEKVLQKLVDPVWLRPGGVVAVERDAKTAEFSWPSGFKAVRERRYGHAVVRYATKDC